MYTLGMSNGDIDIDETGQPSKVSGRTKIIQDISEALNSEYNAIKKFGGRLVTLDLNTKSEIVSEIYTILHRLMDTQTKAEPEEKIKSIDEVEVLQTGTYVYAYIEISSYRESSISDNYVILS